MTFDKKILSMKCLYLYDAAHGVLKGKVVCGDDNKTFMIKHNYTDAQNFNGL